MSWTHHGTLVANTVASVALPDGNYDAIEVINRSGAAEIYFIVLAAGKNGDPTVGGDNTEVLPASMNAIEVSTPDPGPVTVKLISTGAPTYSVRAD